MAQTEQQQGVLEEATIVDADVHLTCPVDDVADYVEEPYRSRLTLGGTYPESVGTPWGGISDRIDYEERNLTSPQRVQENVCDQLHVDYPLLNTNPGIQKLPQTELSVNLMRGYNDFLLDHFLDESEFHGLAAVTPQDPEAAAEELDRLGDEKQIVGAFMGSTGPRTPLGDPRYDVMYRAAEENDLPVAYHAAAAEKFNWDFPKQNQGLETFLSVHTLAHLWGQSLTLTSLISQGVPEKFPDLDFVFLEAGIGWAPYMMWRLNKESSILTHEAPLLERSAEEIIRDQFYFTSQPLGEPENPAQMSQMIDIVGTESIMFASDYPHWDFDHPNELDKHLQSTFTAEERDEVLTETPAAVFDIDA